jgi:hypothetical protein
MSCLSNFIDGVATMEVLQWWRRLDLAKKGGSSREFERSGMWW